MANLAATPLVNAKHYRHFAAITFAITLCVALFANGEARQVVDDGISHEQEGARLRQADADKFGVKRIGDNRKSSGGHSGFGEGYDPSFGASADSAGSRPDTRTSGPSYAAAGVDAAEPDHILSPDEMAKLTPEQQAAYLKQLRSRSAPPRQAEEVHDLAAIEAGSRARSGSSGND